MKYEITKYQIEKLADEDSIVKDCLKEWFPDAFKAELEVGKWYKMKGDIHFLCNFNGNIGNNGNSYGFNLTGKWMDNSMCFHNSDTYVEATPEEVESALINEAKKRGFKNGVTILRGDWYFGFSAPKVTIEKEQYPTSGFEFRNDTLLLDGYIIFYSGNWAEILTQENTVVPMEKALKIIAKKMKVSPENIEIKN
jgi:hypothetical protein